MERHGERTDREIRGLGDGEIGRRGKKMDREIRG
jgi:hypothetical protein